MARGAVCELEWVGAEDAHEKTAAGDGDEDWKCAEPIIREFWGAIDVKGAREVFSVPGLGDGDGSVRQWCEILKIRSQ